MKKKLFHLLFFSMCFLNIHAQNADPAIFIVMQPLSLPLNAYGNLQIKACNLGTTPIVANSLRITLSLGNNDEIIGITSADRWTQFSLTTGIGNTIRLTNNATLNAGDTTIINLNILAKVVSTSNTITSNIVYISAHNPLLAGSPPNTWQGNLDIFNDNSLSSLAVTDLLAINLLQFNGIENNNSNILNWESVSEINANNYELQSSIDGINYTKLSKIDAKGFSSKYNYVDNTVYNAKKIYYRLKMVENDGSFKYSNIVVLKNGKLLINSIYPNPFDNNFNVEIQSSKNDISTIKLIDVNGKILKSQTNSIVNGTNIINVNNLHKISSGIYLIEIITSNDKIVNRILKK